MNPEYALLLVAGYFALLMIIGYITGRKADQESFFIGNRKSPWFLVAFGMIGASLSGVTFMSVPGQVTGIPCDLAGVGCEELGLEAKASSGFYYMQVVFGYLVGYLFIATVLMPIYYRMNLTSIYTYLERRFGFWSYKTGALFFLLSRIIGASLRIFLVVLVLQKFILGIEPFNFPFWATVLITIALIYLYTYKAGIKTIVWTDSLQTAFMIVAIILSIVFMMDGLDMSIKEVSASIKDSGIGKMFFFEASDTKFFFKQFLGGALIATVMTGLDQDMMQKNLSCRSLPDAQKNIFTFSIILVIVNFIILVMGALFFLYAVKNNINSPGRTDEWFATIAMHHLPAAAGVTFLIGLIAAAFSSADSALTSLTTSFCVDFLDMEKKEKPNAKRVRNIVHICFALILFVVVCVTYLWIDRSVISQLFIAAGVTYGPILALFMFGIFTKLGLKDRFVLPIGLFFPTLCFLIFLYSKDLLNGYQVNFAEILALNGLLTFIGLLVISKKSDKNLEIDNGRP